MFLGIDIGSSSSKAVIFDRDRNLLATEVVNLGTGTKGINQVLQAALQSAGVSKEEILYTVVTGYGRMTYVGADKQITEISCHAKGVRFLSPYVRTIVDIGGQDTKIIALDTAGSIKNFAMNDKCAAGTGRFLEVMARVLDCKIEELSMLARKGETPVSISNMCTVFAETEVISHLANNATVEDVAAGAILSIATRVAGMAKRVGIVPLVMMTGGGALNDALVTALSHEVGELITISPLAQAMGALGAAVFASELYEKERKQETSR